MAQIVKSFDPVQYSIAENTFLLSAIGQPPVVAMQNCPQGVNPRAVQPVLENVYDLIELEKHRGQEWVGVEAVKKAISTYLEHSQRWATDRRRNAPRWPSMSTFDDRGKAHRQGVGSDATQVRTYFDADGQRQKFEIELVQDLATDWTPDWKATDAPATGLKVDGDKRRVECLICGHTEGYNPDSRASFNAARARMSKHLRTTKLSPDTHRELHTREFGG